MPNKRSDDKRLVAFWFTHQEAERLAQAALESGTNMTEFVKKAVQELIEKEKEQNGRSNTQHSNGSDSH